jgi:uncharacterized membrane protein
MHAVDYPFSVTHCLKSSTPQKMLQQIVSRPRMTLAVAAGLAAGVLSPSGWHVITRWLMGWNVGCWSYLALMAWLMSLADHGHLRRMALA